MTQGTADRLCAALCAGLVVAAVLATVPVLEMGFNDDWSYAWTARAFATSGHLAYNGWVGSIVGVQAMWAGLLIKLFGFSFTLVRLSTLPFAAGCAILLYRLCRYTGLEPPLALFGTAAITLSPLFIALSASFMTDVFGLFFWLATLYCALLALRAERRATACGWLAAAAAVGLVGGSVRQAVWISPLTVLLAAAWVRRRERTTVAAAAGLWCASAAAMALCLRWFTAATSTGAAGPADNSLVQNFFVDALETSFQLAQGCLLFMLPVLAIHLVGWRKRLRPEFWGLVAGLLVSGLLLGIVLWWFDDDLLMGNIVTELGVLGVGGAGLEALGAKPEVLTAPVRVVLGLAMVVSAGFTGAALLSGFREWRTARTEIGLRRFAWVAAPPSLVYALAVVYRGVVWNLYDRYLIVLLPALVVPLLWRSQFPVRKPLPWFAWALVGVFACYGVVTMHDYLAEGRARLQAASALTAAGIPRTQITAGLEYDAWTELELTGFHAGTNTRKPNPALPQYWFWKYTPSLDPVYFVAYSRLDGLEDTRFGPVRYTAWLAPFHRLVYTQRVPEATARRASSPATESIR